MKNLSCRFINMWIEQPYNGYGFQFLGVIWFKNCFGFCFMNFGIEVDWQND